MRTGWPNIGPPVRSDPVSDLRTNSGAAADLLVELQRDGGEPLHRQLEGAIRSRIRDGRLRAGTSLPSTRRLAAELGVSRGVVVETYQQLAAEGYLASRSGGYTRVALDLDARDAHDAGAAHDSRHAAPSPTAWRAPSTPRTTAPRPPLIDFKYCEPDVTQFPRTAWLRSLRRAVHETPASELAYPTGHGAPALHLALTDYLNRARGTSTRPGNVVVCTGFTQGLALLCQVLAARGARRVAVEDPSDPEIRQVPIDAGLEVVGVPVDDDGLRTDVLPALDADALLLTPAHQCPTGAVLSADARAAVVDWARRHDALVVEDDYDSEYRYDRPPVGALQGLAPDHVVYAGSVSKTLSPGLRLGWLVAPGHLVDELAAAKKVADRGSPVLDQIAFADFLARGELDRHMRRMRPVYRRRRDALLTALREELPEVRPSGVSAGLHLTAWLPPDLDEAAVVAGAARQDLKVYGIADYRLPHGSDGNGNGRRAEGPPGLLFGYASIEEARIRDGIARLAEVIAELRVRS
jgi:GntR family transcriptional regulator / MocR family aminotransferase